VGGARLLDPRGDAREPEALDPHASGDDAEAAPWHFLYFLPLPHGQGSLRPTLGSARRTVCCFSGGASAAPACWPWPCCCPAPACPSPGWDATSCRCLCLNSGSCSSSRWICTRNSFWQAFRIVVAIISEKSVKPSFLYSCFGSFWP